MVKVRIATKEDARDLLDLYSPYVLYTAISFESQPPSIEEFAGRIEKCLSRFPWLVCEVDGQISGYVYASLHRDREAYQWTCECSVYLHENFKGKGFGRILYQALFDVLRAQGMVNLYAGITLPNEASVRLHEKCGFEFFALYKKIGHKQGAWKDVGWWQLKLNDHQPDLPPPLKFSELGQSLISQILLRAEDRIEAALSGQRID